VTVLPLVGGCSDLLVLEPKGPVGEAEQAIIAQAFTLMLIMVIPVIALSL
jgi:cytochrome o ubiquinol oxidase subunit 2